MKKVCIKDVAVINPSFNKTTYPGEAVVSFIPMAAVSEKTGEILNEEEGPLAKYLKGYTYFKKGDLLLAKITPCFENGKITIADIKNEVGFGSTEFITIRTNNKLVLPKYLFYILKSKKFRFLGKGNMTGSAGQKRLRKDFVENFQILLPPLDAQEKLVKILDQNNDLIQKRNLLVEMLDAYLNSVFLEMFNKQEVEWKPLSEISKFIDYRGKTPKKTSKGINLITAKNVREGYLDFNPEEFISEDDYESWMRRGFPREGDVLFTTEAPLGNTAILPEFNKLAFAQRIIIIQPSKIIKSEFLLFALNSKLVKQDIFKRSTGSTVKGIRSKELLKVKIPIPKLEQQERFTSIFNSKQKTKGMMFTQTELLEVQLQALMQKSFTSN